MARRARLIASTRVVRIHGRLLRKPRLATFRVLTLGGAHRNDMAIQSDLQGDFQIPMDREKRLDEIANLRPGWHAGSGSQISAEVIETARIVLREVTAQKIAMPNLFPMEAGGMILEWAAPSVVASLEVLPADLDLIDGCFVNVVEDIKFVFEGAPRAEGMARIFDALKDVGPPHAEKD